MVIPGVSYAMLTAHILNLRIGQPQPLDVDHPQGTCGTELRVEFHDRQTADAFTRDLYAFAAHWNPRDNKEYVRLVRDILEAVCRRDDLSLESATDPGHPARNYELADRLGIGHVFGLQPPIQQDS